jgi:hypothetical protein
MIAILLYIMLAVLFLAGLVPLGLGIWVIKVDRAPGPESALILKLPAFLSGGEVNLRSGTGAFIMVLGIIMMAAAAGGAYAVDQAETKAGEAKKAQENATNAQQNEKAAQEQSSKLKAAAVVQRNPEQKVIREEKLAEPSTEGLHFLSYTAVTNLRTRLDVPPGKEKEKYSPVTRLLYSTIKRVEASAKTVEFEFGTTGVDIDVSCLTHPNAALYQSLQPHKHGDVVLLHTYQVRVNVEDIPVNEPFSILNAATYWNGFQGKEREWAAIVSPSNCDEMVVVLLFDRQKPMRKFELFAYPHNGKVQSYEGKDKAVRSQDGTTFTWKIRHPLAAHAYEVHWEW